MIDSILGGILPVFCLSMGVGVCIIPQGEWLLGIKKTPHFLFFHFLMFFIKKVQKCMKSTESKQGVFLMLHYTAMLFSHWHTA
jgi:hypothetical protein